MHTPNLILERIGLTLTIGLLPITALPSHAQGPLIWDDAWRSDSASIVQVAQRYLTEPDVAVTDKTQSLTGDVHNFEALSIYFWPDPQNPDGPWVARDGVANPDYKLYDLPRLELLGARTEKLSRAYALTRDERYYKAFCRQIDTWFRNASTRMSPHFDYNQFAPGRNGGRGYAAGVIDAYHFVYVLEAIRLVEDYRSLGRRRTRDLRRWMSQFETWMLESETGRQQNLLDNNLGVARDVVLCAIALYAGDRETAETLAVDFGSKRLEVQIMPDGTQPKELTRTRAFFYSTYNLQHILDFCVMLQRAGLGNYNANHRECISSAMNYLKQFSGHQDAWPHQEIGDWQGTERLLKRLEAPMKELRITK